METVKDLDPAVFRATFQRTNVTPLSNANAAILFVAEKTDCRICEVPFHGVENALKVNEMRLVEHADLELANPRNIMRWKQGHQTFGYAFFGKVNKEEVEEQFKTSLKCWRSCACIVFRHLVSKADLTNPKQHKNCNPVGCERTRTITRKRI